MQQRKEERKNREIDKEGMKTRREQLADGPAYYIALSLCSLCLRYNGERV